MGSVIHPVVYDTIQRAGPENCFYYSAQGPVDAPGVGEPLDRASNLVTGSEITAEQPTLANQPVQGAGGGLRFEGDDSIQSVSFDLIAPFSFRWIYVLDAIPFGGAGTDHLGSVAPDTNPWTGIFTSSDTSITLRTLDMDIRVAETSIAVSDGSIPCVIGGAVDVDAAGDVSLHLTYTSAVESLSSTGAGSFVQGAADIPWTIGAKNPGADPITGEMHAVFFCAGTLPQSVTDSLEGVLAYQHGIL